MDSTFTEYATQIPRNWRFSLEMMAAAKLRAICISLTKNLTSLLNNK
jgi:hypothetical protein